MLLSTKDAGYSDVLWSKTSILLNFLGIFGIFKLLNYEETPFSTDYNVMFITFTILLIFVTSIIFRCICIKCNNLSIPLVSRADMLGELMKRKKSIAIARSHGKTTTTSLVGAILEYAKLDPTIINGGIVINTSAKSEKNNRLGSSKWMVVEADESDGSF